MIFSSYSLFAFDISTRIIAQKIESQQNLDEKNISNEGDQVLNMIPSIRSIACGKKSLENDIPLNDIQLLKPIGEIRNNLSAQQYSVFCKLYNFVRHVNRKCTELWPLEEDHDKRSDVKKFIYAGLKKELSNKELFDALKRYILNLDVVEVSILNRYDLMDDKIVKIYWDLRFDK